MHRAPRGPMCALAFATKTCSIYSVRCRTHEKMLAQLRVCVRANVYVLCFSWRWTRSSGCRCWQHVVLADVVRRAEINVICGAACCYTKHSSSGQKLTRSARGGGFAHCSRKLRECWKYRFVWVLAIDFAEEASYGGRFRNEVSGF